VALECFREDGRIILGVNQVTNFVNHISLRNSCRSAQITVRIYHIHACAQVVSRFIRTLFLDKENAILEASRSYRIEGIRIDMIYFKIFKYFSSIKTLLTMYFFASDSPTAMTYAFSVFQLRFTFR
jgi:hypothetical protein